MFWQPGDLGLDHADRFASLEPVLGAWLIERLCRSLQCPGPFVAVAACPGTARIERNPDGHRVQPGAKRVADRQPRPLTCQDQKRCLKSVLGLLKVADNDLTDPQHHRPGPCHSTSAANDVSSMARSLSRANEALEQPRIGDIA